jgi:putative intracellular protease/amidase
VKITRLGVATTLCAAAVTLLATRAAGVFPSPGFDAPAEPASAPKKVWVCPPCHDAHDEKEYDAPGACPVCGMELIEKTQLAKAEAEMAARMAPSRERRKAQILVFPGVEIIDFGAPYEIMGQAGFDVATVAEKPESFGTAMGLKITPDFALDKAPQANVIIVPGGDVTATQQSPAVQAWLKQRAEKAEVVMSVCNGAFILAKAGLLDGKSATTFAPLIEGLRAAAPKTTVVSDKRWVDNGKVVTTAGLSSGIDGAIHVVEKLLGRGRAQQLAVTLEYHWDPEGRWVRAQLADRPLRKLRGAAADWEVVAYDGDTARWEGRWRVAGGDADAVLASVTRALGVEAKNGAFTMKDETGAWKGETTAAKEGDGAVLVTVRIARGA